MSYASYMITNLESEVSQLREQNAALKNERDEAIRTRDEIQQQLLNLLAVIHRDGGQYTDEHGMAAAIERAHDIVIQGFS